MKKTLSFITLLLFIFSIAGCGMFDQTTELPNLENMNQDGIRDTLNAHDLSAEFFVDESIVYSEPNVFVDYMNHEEGEEVEKGTTIAVVVSSSLEDDDDEDREPAPTTPLDQDGEFTDAENVALYLDTFHALPDNFGDEDITEYDATGHAVLPNDGFDYQAVDVDEGSIIYSDEGLIFHKTGEDTYDQLFGTPDHPPLDPDEPYTDTEKVALYIRTFGKLPPNYFIRYEDETNLYQSAYGYLPDFYDEYPFPTLSNLRSDEEFNDYGQEAYFGYWHFSNHANQLPDLGGHYFIADTKIAGAGHDRGDDRFVFHPEHHIVYYTDDHFYTYELWYGDARSD